MNMGLLVKGSFKKPVLVTCSDTDGASRSNTSGAADTSRVAGRRCCRSQPLRANLTINSSLFERERRPSVPTTSHNRRFRLDVIDVIDVRQHVSILAQV